MFLTSVSRVRLWGPELSNRESAASKCCITTFEQIHDQQRSVEKAIINSLFTVFSSFFFFSRSLAYNNLETLPKDLFKGLEALTKV